MAGSADALIADRAISLPVRLNSTYLVVRLLFAYRCWISFHLSVLHLQPVIRFGVQRKPFSPEMRKTARDFHLNGGSYGVLV